MFEAAVALVTLTAMEIVLGIDNIIFIAIVAGRLPKEQQAKARQIGLLVAVVTRLGLLFALFYLAQLNEVTVFRLTSLGFPENWLPAGEYRKTADAISVKDLVLIIGGAFLLAKSTMEIHHKLEVSEEEHAAGQQASFAGVIVQIGLLDIVFSLDSVITAIGMVRADPTKGVDWQAIGIMVTAMLIALGVMLVFAGYISDFVARHPTIKILALAFLILIGVMLIAEGFEGHFNKGYIYFAMAFSVGIELLNMRLRAKAKPVELRDERIPNERPGP